MDLLILKKYNSENQARQYSSQKHVANVEWWANHKKKKTAVFEYYPFGLNNAATSRILVNHAVIPIL